MKLKRIVSYTVDPMSRWAGLSAALMGLGFFSQAIYYFTVHNLTLCGTGEIIFCMVLPLLVSFLWMLLVRTMPLKQPMIFGILAALVCLSLMIQGFFGGSTLQIVLGTIWYILATAVIIFVSFGYLPYRILIFAVCLLPAALRGFLAYATYIRTGDYWKGLPEYSAVMMLLALACFAGMLKKD